MYPSIANLNIILYDDVNKILLHILETGSIIFYLDFATINNYMNAPALSITVANTDPAQ